MPLTTEQLVALAMADDFDAPGRWVRVDEHSAPASIPVWACYVSTHPDLCSIRPVIAYRSPKGA